MDAELVFTTEASDDISDAFAWYEERRPGLGEEFLSCLDARLQQVRRQPEAHQVVYDSFRRALVRRFPYGVFYEFQDEVVTVYAVFHTAEDPDKWRDRL